MKVLFALAVLPLLAGGAASAAVPLNDVQLDGVSGGAMTTTPVAGTFVHPGADVIPLGQVEMFYTDLLGGPPPCHVYGSCALPPAPAGTLFYPPGALGAFGGHLGGGVTIPLGAAAP